MKKLIFTSMLFLASFLTMATDWPTQVVVVQPDAGISTGALNAAVAQYGGTRIYELKRGGLYVLNAAILPSHPIYIRAEAGTGARPMLQPGVDISGVSVELFRFSGDARLENLYMTGVDELGKVVKNIIRVSLPNLTITVDKCFFDYDEASTFRIEGANCKFYFTNCVFRNNMNLLSPSNGRPLDTRGNAVELFSIENCTFYNMTSTLIRTANAPIKQFIFNQNTVYTNVGGLNFQYSQHVVANNNIFYNCGLTGSEITSGGIIRIDSIKTSVVGMTEGDRTFDFRNNLFFREKRYNDIQKLGAGCPNNTAIDSIFHPNVIPFINNGQFKIDGLLRQDVPFTNAPQEGIAYLDYWWSKCLVSTISLGSGETMPVFAADEDPLTIGEATGANAYNFGYPQSSPLATAGLGGKPMGDLNWLSFYTGISHYSPAINKIKVFANKSANTLTFDCADISASRLDVRIYSVTGSLVSSKNNLYASGNSFNMALPQLTNGIYVYLITLDNKTTERGKFIVK
ncbi:MAG: T9SS type A sorting domain-containing protein [Bacteroidales bacterium]|nr:T9SS type A sorting domain-containing protein [Bacteroidales bacterium]